MMMTGRMWAKSFWNPIPTPRASYPIYCVCSKSRIFCLPRNAVLTKYGVISRTTNYILGPQKAGRVTDSVLTSLSNYGYERPHKVGQRTILPAWRFFNACSNLDTQCPSRRTAHATRRRCSQKIRRQPTQHPKVGFLQGSWSYFSVTVWYQWQQFAKILEHFS